MHVGRRIVERNQLDEALTLVKLENSLEVPVTTRLVYNYLGHSEDSHYFDPLDQSRRKVFVVVEKRLPANSHFYVAPVDFGNRVTEKICIRNNTLANLTYH